MAEFVYVPSNKNPIKKLLMATVAVVAISNSAYWYLWYLEQDAAPEMVQSIPGLSSQFQRLLKEAKQGIMSSQFKVAQALETGDGTFVDPEQAAYWYEQAARQGHISAAFVTGNRYEKGDGFRQNFATAARWYRLAAGLGNDMRAQFALGELFFNGRGVPHDYGEAIEWYRKAANQGHPVAQYLLGVLYQEGWGVDRSLMEAYKWFLLSARHQDEVVKASRKYNPERSRSILAGKLNGSQIKEAEKQAEAWLSNPRRR